MIPSRIQLASGLCQWLCPVVTALPGPSEHQQDSPPGQSKCPSSILSFLPQFPTGKSPGCQGWLPSHLTLGRSLGMQSQSGQAWGHDPTSYNPPTHLLSLQTPFPQHIAMPKAFITFPSLTLGSPHCPILCLETSSLPSYLVGLLM